MLDFTLPFYPESYINHKRYLESRQDYLEKKYFNKQVMWLYELIGISGAIRHEKGGIVVIDAIEYESVKIRTIEGEPIYGLFNIRCFKLL